MNDPWIADPNPEPRPSCGTPHPWGVWTPPRFVAASPDAPPPIHRAWDVSVPSAREEHMVVLPPARKRTMTWMTATEQVTFILGAQAALGISLPQLAARIDVAFGTMSHWRFGRHRMRQTAVDAIIALLEGRHAPE